MGFPAERLYPQVPRTKMSDDSGEVTYEWRRWFGFLRNTTPKTETYNVTVTPTAVGANTTSEQTTTVLGLVVGSLITVTKPTHTAGIGIVNARVSASDTLAITYMNVTGGAVTPPSESYVVQERRL
jgi:hypothetical protein